MENNNLFETTPQTSSKLTQGVFRNKFYFGKVVQVNSQNTDALIMSDGSTLVNYQQGNNKYVQKSINQIREAGLLYKQNLINLFPGWDNKGIIAFQKGKTIIGKELFNEVRTKLSYYIDTRDERILDLVTVYIIATYCFTLFNSTGYLLFHSDKESGKTKLLQLIGLMCFNPINATNPSESALFRLCDSAQPTLLIDDYEKIPDEKLAVINQMLKVGYKKGGQTIRTERIGGERFEPQIFDVYCPKVITNTSGLESITLSRCIVIRLLKTKTEKGSLEPDENSPHFQEIRDSCYTFIMHNWKQIQETYQNYKSDKFNNRKLELVKGVLSIAKTIDPTIESNLVQFLQQSFEDRDLEDISTNWEYLLFSSIHEHVEEAKYYALSEISEWCRDKIEFDKPKNLARWIGKNLSKISLFKKRRVGQGIQYYLTKELVKEYMELTEYPIEDTQSTSTTLDFNGEKIAEMPEAILDICQGCNQKKFVLYRNLTKIGKNYCKACVETDQKALYKLV